MINYVKEAHTAIFTGPTSCGKTRRVLDLIEKEYKHHFENVVIICPTLRWNSTYLDRSWVFTDAYVFVFEPKENLLKIIEKLSSLLSGEKTLPTIDDVIADETLDKTRGALLNIAISGRHRNHSLWMLTQRYKKLPITVRDQAKQLFVWFPKSRHEFELIAEENDVEKNVIPEIKERLKAEKHACLYVRLEHPRDLQVLK